MDGYRALQYHVFVLRFRREGAGGAWRGQIVHLPDQATAAFAHWSQARAFVGRYLPEADLSDDVDPSASPSTPGDL